MTKDYRPVATHVDSDRVLQQLNWTLFDTTRAIDALNSGNYASTLARIDRAVRALTIAKAILGPVRV